jgi:hypothetical protein
MTSKSKDVQISDFTNTLELSLERGDIELRPGKLPLAKIDVRTRNGAIDLALPTGAKFDLRAKVDKGEVQNDFGAPLQTDTEGRGATIRGLSGDGPQVVLNCDRGSITVRKGSTFAPAKEPKLPVEVEAPEAPPAPPKSPRVPAPTGIQ